ncbi:AAA family ATPase [Butyrivibrio sp. JL13D10]|uniref:AAA family ATPase n=1 Tax=Butyrivibrio sp. JL13D10 TaxID=3236815 RepID=UPI0038B5CFA6
MEKVFNGAGEKIQILADNMKNRLIGKDDVIRKVITVLLSGGHVLLEDVPGVGKTSLAKALSDSLSCSFARIQCTPDTMPSDITGLSVYHMDKGEFEVIPGPVVNQIVLADEINRTSPKTQASLLEAMEERQVTIDGNTITIPEPFMVIGTQNPMEMAGTYPLPEAQLDRFMMKLSVGYPSQDSSIKIAEEFLGGSLHGETEQVLGAEDIIAMKNEVTKVEIHKDLVNYAVSIIEDTRKNHSIKCGASTRALLDLLRAAQARSYIEGRDYCIPMDIIESAKDVLPHRMILSADARMNKITQETVILQILNNRPVPQ